MLGFQACATISGFLHHIFEVLLTQGFFKFLTTSLTVAAFLPPLPNCPYTLIHSRSFFGKDDPRLDEQHLYNSVTTCNQLFPSGVGAGVISNWLESLQETVIMCSTLWTNRVIVRLETQAFRDMITHISLLYSSWLILSVVTVLRHL